MNENNFGQDFGILERPCFFPVSPKHVSNRFSTIVFFPLAPFCLQGLGVGLLYWAVSGQRNDCFTGQPPSLGWPNPSSVLYGFFFVGVCSGAPNVQIAAPTGSYCKPRSLLKIELSFHICCVLNPRFFRYCFAIFYAKMLDRLTSIWWMGARSCLIYASQMSFWFLPAHVKNWGNIGRFI